MVFTDSPVAATRLAGRLVRGVFRPVQAGDGGSAAGDRAVARLVDLLLPDAPRWVAPHGFCGWRHLVIRGEADGSQYDALLGLAREGGLPDGVACFALEGRGFHGSRDRRWVALPGNLHLVASLTPGRPVRRAEVAFTALAATAVVEAVDRVAGMAGRASIRWVNDILVDEAKIGGVLAWSALRGDVVTEVVLGIGLNVEKTPEVERSAAVPGVGSLREAAPIPGAVTLDAVVPLVLESLARHWSMVVREGPEAALQGYRRRSAVLGRDVVVVDDTPAARPAVLAAGRVEGLGDDLSLRLSGHPAPLRRGRLLWSPRPGHLP